MSTNVEEPSETTSCCGPSGGDIAGDFVLVEHAPDGRQESRELFGELGVVLSHRSKRHELFADQVVESTLRAKAALDPLCRSALLRPDLLEPHAETIAFKTRGVQSFTLGDGSGEAPSPDDRAARVTDVAHLSDESGPDAGVEVVRKGKAPPGRSTGKTCGGNQLRESPEQLKMTLENVTWLISTLRIA